MRLKKNRGFSLVEAAMVLGIIGLVVGGIWAVAADVRSKTIYNAYVSELVVTIDNLNKTLVRTTGSMGDIGNYAEKMGWMPTRARYGIETIITTTCPNTTGEIDLCLMIGDILSYPLSQNQCKYIGLALRPILSGNPMLVKQVDSFNSDGDKVVWWTRENGFTALNLDCGRDALAAKPGTYTDTIIEIRF